MSSKVLIIGVDGGTFRFIKPLVDEGRLPTFKMLMDKGVHGILRSTAPPITAPAWTTFMTGKNPGQHGLFHFISFPKNSYDYYVINATNCRSKTMFRLASDAGRRVISINVPVTYPPENLNGIVVSGMLSPKGKTFTYPERLTEELLEQGYRIDVWDEDFDDAERYLNDVMDMSRKRLEVSRRLLSTNSWDLAMVTFTGADRLQHKMWEREDLIRRYYILLDGLIGDLLTLVDDSTYVMVMSDHGFTPVKGTFLVNQWLADNGLLRRNRFLGKMPSTWVHLLGHRRHGFVSRLKYLVSSVISAASRGRLLGYPRMSINFEKSRVFARPAPVMFVNRKDRWFCGMVEPGEEYEKLKRSICERLGDLRDPKTGEKIVEDALIKDDIYSGECFDEAPDIVLLPRDEGYDFLALESYHSYVRADPIRKSCHSMNGIFFLSGPEAQKGVESGVVQMVDCMPTILQLLDVPIPEDVDGRILRELFVDGSTPRVREARRQGSSQTGERELEKVSGKDERLMEDRLRELGYLS